MIESGHLHVLTRNGDDVGGSMSPLNRTDVEKLLNGTPYRDETTLWNVVTGKATRGTSSSQPAG